MSTWIRINFDQLAPDPGEQKWPTKIERSVESSECLMLLMRAEGFSCCMDVLRGGGLPLEIKKSAFFIFKKFCFSFLILQSLVIKTPDPELESDPELAPDPDPNPHWPKMLDPDPYPYPH
jgi:hypothetical protein